jgi:hypothetical protein
MTDAAQARTLLAQQAKSLAAKHHDELDELKLAAKDLDRPDWLWHALLVSASTLGSSRGYKGLIENKENYNRVTFDNLAKLPQQGRHLVLGETLNAAKVRMAAIKAARLAKNFDCIVQLGGPLAAKQDLLSRNGCAAKIEFLRRFAGVGAKYSRNIMMDVYHPDFWETIAVDARVKEVSKCLGISFKNNEYEEHERFYLGAAHEAGIQGWELDRLIYSFKEEFLRALSIVG